MSTSPIASEFSSTHSGSYAADRLAHAGEEVLGVGEEQRRVVAVDDQARARVPRRRVVVDVVHAGDAGHDTRGSRRAGGRPGAAVDERQADSDQHAVQDAEAEHGDRGQPGPAAARCAGTGRSGELRDVDEPQSGVDDERAERGRREAAPAAGRRRAASAGTTSEATSEYSWVRLPTASPSAVRLPLLLTGKPCSSARRDVGRAEREQLLVRRRPLVAVPGGERAAGEHVVGVADDGDAQRRAAAAPRGRRRRRTGRPGPAAPDGTVADDRDAVVLAARTRRPRRPRASTTISGPGSRWRQSRCSANSSTASVPRHSATVGQWI